MSRRFPNLLDSDGGRLQDGYNNDDIARISFDFGEEHFVVACSERENCNAFIERAFEAAHIAMNATVMLPSYSGYI